MWSFWAEIPFEVEIKLPFLYSFHCHALWMNYKILVYLELFDNLKFWSDYCKTKLTKSLWKKFFFLTIITPFVSIKNLYTIYLSKDPLRKYKPENRSTYISIKSIKMCNFMLQTNLSNRKYKNIIILNIVKYHHDHWPWHRVCHTSYGHKPSHFINIWQRKSKSTWRYSIHRILLPSLHDSCNFKCGIVHWFGT